MLNWIESEFAALRYFALNGTDHRSHGEQTTSSPATSAGAKTSLPQDQLRRQLTYPKLDQLPGQGCVTSH
jgi:hypothetical protein